MLSIQTTRWRDMHLHLRQGALMKKVAPHSARYCSYVLWMPNPEPAVLTANRASEYQKECVEALGPDCVPMMSMKMTPHTKPEEIVAASAAGVRVIKCYPENMTNSDHGIPREMFLDPPKQFLDCGQAAQKCEMSWSFHGELPGSFCLDAEFDFLPVLRQFVRNHLPFMRVVLEHVTTAAGVETIRQLRREGYRVAGTITSHHLKMKNGLGDVIGRYLRPDHHCLPIPKRPEDVEALIGAATSGEECFFWGSDSAPHPPEKKYAAQCCGGCYTAPDPEMLIEIFEEQGCLDKIQGFVAGHATSFYELPPPDGKLKFVRKPRVVPETYDGIVPFMSKKTLNWTLE